MGNPPGSAWGDSTDLASAPASNSRESDQEESLMETAVIAIAVFGALSLIGLAVALCRAAAQDFPPAGIEQR